MGSHRQSLIPLSQSHTEALKSLTKYIYPNMVEGQRNHEEGKTPADTTKTGGKKPIEMLDGVLDLSKIPETRMEMRRLYVAPISPPRVKTPSMLQSSSAPLGYFASFPKSKIATARASAKNKIYGKRPLVDTPIQATEEKNLHAAVPRSTMLSRTRNTLSKRNSMAQSSKIKFVNVKMQTESLASQNKASAVEPLDFIGLYEKGTNFPNGVFTGHTREQGTQMYEHITQSELFCIEWIHRNLFEVKMNPNTLVVDDRIRDLSESACVT